MKLLEYKELILSWTKMSECQWQERQRIVKALQKIDDFRRDEWTKSLDVMSSFTKRGMEAAFRQAFHGKVDFSEEENIRFDLENTFLQLEISEPSPTNSLSDRALKTTTEPLSQEFALAQAEIIKKERQLRQAINAQRAIDIVDEIHNRRMKFHRWIHEYQVKQGVSGICPAQSEIMGELLIFPFNWEWGVEIEDGERESVILDLIWSDIALLQDWIQPLTTSFLRIATKHNCTLYRDNIKLSRHLEYPHDALTPVSMSEILNAVQTHPFISASINQPESDHFVLEVSPHSDFSYSEDTLRVYAIAEGKTNYDIIL